MYYTENIQKVYHSAHFLQLSLTTIEDFLKKIKEISKKSNEEECGIITEESFYHLENKSNNKKEYFIIDPKKYFEINEKEKVKIIWHSHPEKTESPSYFDVISQIEADLPYLIYGAKTDRFFYLDDKLFFSFAV
jgi:proteasome lid subunit RPN8/RPN11